MSGAAWRQPAGQPLLYHQLDELAYLAIKHDVRGPALALDKLRGERKGFLFAPEMDVYRDADRIAEIDLWIVADGDIAIGEAKTTDVLDRDAATERRALHKLRVVAEAVTAHEVVLATTAPHWADRTTTVAEKVLGGQEFRLRLLTNLAGE